MRCEFLGGLRLARQLSGGVLKVHTWPARCRRTVDTDTPSARASRQQAGRRRRMLAPWRVVPATSRSVARRPVHASERLPGRRECVRGSGRPPSGRGRPSRRSSSSTTRTRWDTLRPRRSSFVTTTESPASTSASGAARTGRSSRRPDAVSTLSRVARRRRRRGACRAVRRGSASTSRPVGGIPGAGAVVAAQVTATVYKQAAARIDTTIGDLDLHHDIRDQALAAAHDTWGLTL